MCVFVSSPLLTAALPLPSPCPLSSVLSTLPLPYPFIRVSLLGLVASTFVDDLFSFLLLGCILVRAKWRSFQIDGWHICDCYQVLFPELLEFPFFGPYDASNLSYDVSKLHGHCSYYLSRKPSLEIDM